MTGRGKATVNRSVAGACLGQHPVDPHATSGSGRIVPAVGDTGDGPRVSLFPHSAEPCQGAVRCVAVRGEWQVLGKRTVVQYEPPAIAVRRPSGRSGLLTTGRRPAEAAAVAHGAVAHFANRLDGWRSSA